MLACVSTRRAYCGRLAGDWDQEFHFEKVTSLTRVKGRWGGLGVFTPSARTRKERHTAGYYSVRRTQRIMCA